MGGTGIEAVSGRGGLTGGLGAAGIGTACCMTAGVGGVVTAPSLCDQKLRSVFLDDRGFPVGE